MVDELGIRKDESGLVRVIEERIPRGTDYNDDNYEKNRNEQSNRNYSKIDEYACELLVWNNSQT